MAERKQNMLVFDNYSHFFPFMSGGFHMLIVELCFSGSLSISSEVGFIIELSAPITLEFVYVRRT